jgi:uncharacterized OB-fold protein
VADAGDEREAWLARDAAGHVSLLGRWSPTSGRHHFPPAALCPYPGADDVELVPLPQRGSLWAWTAVTSAPPGYEGPIRYGFGTEPPVMLVRAVDLGLEALRERHQRQEFQENV